MKIKKTENGNFKLNLKRDELRVLLQIVSHVQLGVSEKADVILDMISQLDNLDYGIADDLDPIKVITEIDDGVASHMIVV